MLNLLLRLPVLLLRQLLLLLCWRSLLLRLLRLAVICLLRRASSSAAWSGARCLGHGDLLQCLARWDQLAPK